MATTVKFLMVAEVTLEDEGYDAWGASRDAEKLLDVYREAAAYTVGTEFGVAISRVTDEDLLPFDILGRIPPSPSAPKVQRCFVPPAVTL